MQLHDYALALTAFFSELLGTLSGFGSSTFFVPVGSYFESFKFILALTALLHCFGNAAKLIVFKGHFDWRTFLKLAPPATAFVLVGAALTPFVEVRNLERGLGLSLIFIAGAMLVRRRSLDKIPGWLAVVLTSISGFCTGIVGTGGAIRGIALAGLKLESGTFITLSAAIDLGGDVARAIVYLTNGFMDWTQWFYVPVLGLAAWFGTRGGKKILSHINQAHFEKLVAVFVFASGVLLVIGRTG